MKSVAGLILAAGKSERMGSPKPLLKIFNTTFLEHIYSEAAHSKLVDVKIVLGHQSDLIIQKLPQLRAHAIVNPGYEQGQLSSLVWGLQALGNQAIDGLMLFLVDHPFVSSHLINELLEKFSGESALIVIPTFHMRRGHPVIFARDLFSQFLTAPLDQGALGVVRRYERDILHVELEDEGILIDIDTPQAYQRYVIGTAQN